MPNSTCLIRPATLKDLEFVQENLVDAGKQDMMRASINPVIAFLIDFKKNSLEVAMSPDNLPMVLFGVTTDGNVWMHMTNEVYKYPRFFMKATKAWIESQPHKMLYNYVDIQNTTLLKMVKRLGFKFLRVVAMPPNNNYYVEFAQIWER